MHIDNDKLVGTYVSDRYSEKGTVTIVLTDGDSTPTREYTRYKYVQTEQLTAIGVAVKDYGAVLVPETTIELFTNGTLNSTDFGVFVKFNDDYYSISLSQLLAAIVSAPIEFEENSFDDYPTVTFNGTLPPYSVGNAGQVPTVDENGKVGWNDIPEELPAVTGNTGKFLGVNNDASGVEWKNVPNELPTIGDSDAGKVLKVNADHTGVEWGEAGGGGSTIGYPTIFLQRSSNKANGATNGELYTALDNYNSNEYKVVILAGDSNKEITIPLTISYVSGHPRTLKGTGINYSSISGTSLTIKIFEITVTIDNNLAEYNPNLTITETTKTITVNS